MTKHQLISVQTFRRSLSGSRQYFIDSQYYFAFVALVQSFIRLSAAKKAQLSRRNRATFRVVWTFSRVNSVRRLITIVCVISGYVLERRFTKFGEITQCNGHYAVQGHSRSPTLVPIESSYTTYFFVFCNSVT